MEGWEQIKLLMEATDKLLFPRVGEGSEGCLPGNGGLDFPSLCSSHLPVEPSEA